MARFTVELEQDTDPQNPRTDYDHLGTMICFHKRYDLGDTGHGYRSSDYDSWEELEEQIVKDHGAIIALPLYLYDHGGITMSTGPFGCPWDSGMVGIIFITMEKVREEYSWRRITAARRDQICTYLKGEVETYDQYLTGDVWGYIVKDEDGGEVDSCWGFYGSEFAQEQGQDSADWFEANTPLQASLELEVAA